MTLHSNDYLEGWTIAGTRYGKESGGYDLDVQSTLEEMSYES